MVRTILRVSVAIGCKMSRTVGFRVCKKPSSSARVLAEPSGNFTLKELEESRRFNFGSLRMAQHRQYRLPSFQGRDLQIEPAVTNLNRQNSCQIMWCCSADPRMPSIAMQYPPITFRSTNPALPSVVTMEAVPIADVMNSNSSGVVQPMNGAARVSANTIAAIHP